MVKGKVTDHLTGTMLSGILITVTGDTQTAITNKLGEFMLRFPMHMAGSKITLAATYANATSIAAAHTYITGDTLILSEKNPATVHLYRYPEEHHPPTEIKWKWIRPIPPHAE